MFWECLDHLVYATPDLHRRVVQLESHCGVRAAPGGSHPGRGIRNALIGLGPRQYLEVIAPDSARDVPRNPRWFAVDSVRKPRFTGWAIACADLEGVRRRAMGSGAILGEVMEGSRMTPSGRKLAWKFTDPSAVSFDGLMPSLMDRGGGAHPGEGLAPGLSLASPELSHSDPDTLHAALKSVGMSCPVIHPGAPRARTRLTSRQDPRKSFELE